MELAVVAWFALGVFAGSVAYRLADYLLERRSADPPGASFTPRCPRCGATRRLLANVATIARPLRQRCRECGFLPGFDQIAWEIGVGVAFAILAAIAPTAVEAAWAAIVTLTLVVATLTDLRARIIPNALTFPMSAAAMVASFLPGGVGIVAAALGGAMGFGLAMGIWLLGRLLYRRGDVFGLGDVKLAMFIGAALGSQDVVRALVYGILAGGASAVALLFLGRSRKTTMPYGPAMALGAFAALVTR